MVILNKKVGDILLELDKDGLWRYGQSVMNIGSTVTISQIKDNGCTRETIEGAVIGMYPYGFLCRMKGKSYNEFFRYNLLRCRESGIQISVKKKGGV